MEALKISEIAAYCGGEVIGADDVIRTISTSSKNAAFDGCFVALEGEKFDGHDFISEYMQSGRAAVSQKDIAPPEGKSIIKVADTKKALRDIAKGYRSRFNIPVVGITGSVGKTSTKDMVAEVLSQHYNTHKTEGNFNNEVGLPLSVFRINREHEVSVLEMGMNNKGEISRLSAIANPEVAIITNIGTAHIGNLGSVENILAAKLEILDYLPRHGLVILNGDDPILWNLRGSLPYPAMYYGIDNYFSDIVAQDIVMGNNGSKFSVKINGDEHRVRVNAVGKHHIFNALAAILAGQYYKVPAEKIVNGVAAFKPGNMRQNIYKIKSATIIEDCYNANFDSMKSAIDVLHKLSRTGISVAVLGDMLELGTFSQETHEKVGQYLAQNEIGVAVTVGQEARHIAAKAKECGVPETHTFDTNAEAAIFLTQYLNQNACILIKASRGMKFEEIAIKIKENI